GAVFAGHRGLGPRLAPGGGRFGRSGVTCAARHRSTRRSVPGRPSGSRARLPNAAQPGERRGQPAAAAHRVHWARPGAGETRETDRPVAGGDPDGVGGVGKTRLALQAAASLTPQFDDGAWLVDLGPVDDADLVGAAVAAELKLPDRRQGSPQDAIVASARPGP